MMTLCYGTLFWGMQHGSAIRSSWACCLIGPPRSGACAFVSPVVAVALGIAVFGETAGLIDIAAMIVMLVAARLAMAGQE